MLEQSLIKRSITDEDKAIMKEENKVLSLKLATLQQTIKENKIPVMVVFEGWSASGKGSVVGKLIKNLDPRGFNVYVTDKMTDEEKRKPYMWQFWNSIPASGEMTVYDKSWYHDFSMKYVEDINTFERSLNDNGYLIVKFFLNISKKEQSKRLKKLMDDKNTAWRVDKGDIKENDNYDKLYKKFDSVIEATNTEYAGWNVVSGMDKTAAMNVIFKTLIGAIEARVTEKSSNGETTGHVGILPGEMEFPLVNMPLLAEVPLDESIEDAEYRVKLERLQKKLNELSYKLYRKNIPMVICYEGWDAAGKGGNIKRVASALDPRDYDVAPIAAPSIEEKSRHFLWRFWKHIPKTGHIQIFDRTWYGRVMVERLEGFCSENDWKRAYNEINEFEKNITDWGGIVVKFWLQIDKDEQLARFTERQNTPEKQYKITDEDWRNREKWDKYEVAVNDMIKYTSTENAPWYIIGTNCKQLARLKTLQILIDAMENAL